MRSQNRTSKPLETAHAIDVVANYEPKIITYLALNEAKRPVSSHELAKSITKHTGLRVGTASVDGYLKTFAKFDFASSGRELRQKKGTLVFTATGQEVALPVIGSFLEWSNTHGLPLVSVLSESQSANDTHAPTNTLKVFHTLLQRNGSITAPSRGTTDGALKDEMGEVLKGRMHRLVNSGHIKSTDVIERFRILDPVYKGSNPKRLKPETKAVYEALSAAKEIDANKLWIRSEIVNLALSKEIITDDLLEDFRYQLVYAVSDKCKNRFPGAVEKQPLFGKQYSIAPVYATAIRDLVSRAELVDTATAEIIEQYRTKAENAYADGAQAALVWKRGKIAAGRLVRQF